MIDRIAARMGNPPDVELRVAGRELARITKKRLEKIAP